MFLEDNKKLFTEEQLNNIKNNIDKIEEENKEIKYDNFEDILKALSFNNDTLKLVKFDSYLESNKYNEFMFNINNQLKNQYTKLYLISDMLKIYDNNVQENINSIDTKINNLKYELEQLKFINSIENDNVISAFITPLNMSYYTQQYHECKNEDELKFLFSDPRDLSIIKETIENKNNEYFILPQNKSIKAINQNTKIQEYGSNVLIEFNNTNDMIDNNYNSFYGDIIVSTERIQKPYFVKIDNRDDDKFSIDVISDGITYDINIILDSAKIINEIDVNFMSKYESTIKYILYKETSHKSEEFKVYKAKQNIMSEGGNVSIILDNPIYAKEIRIITNQNTFEKRQYDILLSDYNNIELIKKVLRAEKDITLKDKNKNLTQEEINELTNMNVYKARLEKFKREWAAYQSSLNAYYSVMNDLERIREIINNSPPDYLSKDRYNDILSGYDKTELAELIRRNRGYLIEDTYTVQRTFLKEIEIMLPYYTV